MAKDSPLTSNDTSVPSRLRVQWTNPSDILSILLIVGADVIKTALAQFNGQYFKPVAFSFGWVAYAYSYLLMAVGGLKLVPEADFPCLLINCSNGKVWDRTSWLLGRILDCYNDIWMPDNVKTAKSEIFDRMAEQVHDAKRLEELSQMSKAGNLGLVVSIFRPSMATGQGVPKRDKVVWMGIATTIVQLGISAIPYGLDHEWEILTLTASGTALAWLMGFLQERSTLIRRNTRKTFVMTKGPGYGDAIVILGNGSGLDLDDLANEISFREGKARHWISITVDLFLVILWTALLITTSGLESNTWYLVCIGSIGMLQNIYIAGARRHPSAYGIHLELDSVISSLHVMETLKILEERYPKVGRHLLPVMYPGPLRDEEIRWWAKAETKAEPKAENTAENIVVVTHGSTIV